MKNQKLKVVKAPKVKFSWVAEILKVEVGGSPLVVEIADGKRVKPLLSREVKLKDPTAVYLTDQKSMPGYLLIYRTA